MKSSSRFIAGLTLASMMLAAPVSAQNQGSMQVGGATVSVGVGAELLTLPDIDLILRINNSFNTLNKFENNDISDTYGLSFNGSLEFPIFSQGANPKTLVVSGFYGQIDNTDTQACIDGGVNLRCSFMSPIDRPGLQDKYGFSPAAPLITRTKREVDHHGISVEAKRALASLQPRYISLGLDYRAINQDVDVNSSVASVFGTETFLYQEDLDTNYYGVTAAFGGNYSLPLVGSMTSGLGLQSSFKLWGGIYYTDTDYSGRSTVAGPGVGASAGSAALSLSRDDTAFIGGLTLETSKRLGKRSAITLRSDYTYYSWVPDMSYDDTDSGGVAGNTGFNAVTSIGDDDAFSARTTLRLTIQLGPDSVFEQPVK